MKKLLVLMILMMICLGGCSNETVLSDDQIKEKIREANTAAKLKEKFKNIGFDEMRDELLATVYDDQNSTLISYANEDGDTIRSELYSKDFRYSYGVEGEFSQEVYLAQREDVWQKAERYLSDMEFIGLETTDVFYIISGQIMGKDFEKLFQSDKPVLKAAMTVVADKDFVIHSIQNQVVTYEDKSEETLSDLELRYDAGEIENEVSEVLKKHFDQNKDFRSCTVITDAQSGGTTSVQYNIAKGVKSGVVTGEGYRLIKRLSTPDEEDLSNDVTYYITDKEGDDLEKEHEGTMSPDGVYTDDASGFVVVNEYIPDVLLEIRYASAYNFVGEKIDGYTEPQALLSKEAAQALKKAADQLYSQGYIIKIYDAYRPQMAVDHFLRWAQDVRDTRMKSVFYPDVDKKDLFVLGYVAEHSSHSRGSTIDMTIVDMKTGKEVDMGSPFDFFGEISHGDYTELSEEQLKNRQLLKDVMTSNGFAPYAEEWWHFTLENEPYPNTYFSFPISKDALR